MSTALAEGGKSTEPYPFCNADTFTDQRIEELAHELEKADSEQEKERINRMIAELRESENFIH